MRTLLLTLLFASSLTVQSQENKTAPVTPKKKEKITGTLYSMSVGKVGDHYATSREVHISYLAEYAINKQHSKKWVPQLLKESTAEFKKEVTSFLLEKTVLEEAKIFKTVQVSPEEIKATKIVLNKKLTKSAPWAWLKVTKKEMNELVYRKILAKKFIRFKVGSSVVPITDKEAQEYFTANRLKFGNMPFENFRDNIKSFLSREQMDRRLRDWFQVLQSKYRVRNYLSEL